MIDDLIIPPTASLSVLGQALVDKLQEIARTVNGLEYDREFVPMGSRDRRCEDLEARIGELLLRMAGCEEKIVGLENMCSLLRGMTFGLLDRVDKLEKAIASGHQAGRTGDGVPR